MIRLKRLRTGTLLLCVASTWVATLMAAQPDPAPSGTFYLDDYSSWRLQYEYTVGGLRQNWTNVSARLYPTVGSQEQDLTYYEPVFVERYKIALFEALYDNSTSPSTQTFIKHYIDRPDVVLGPYTPAQKNAPALRERSDGWITLFDTYANDGWYQAESLQLFHTGFCEMPYVYKIHSEIDDVLTGLPLQRPVLGWALDQNGDVYTDIAQESPVNVTPALSTDDWFEYEQSASKVITSMEMNTAAFVCGHFDTADYVFISSNIGSFYCGQLTVSPSGYLCMLLTCCSTIDTGLSAIRDPACAAFQVNQDVEAVSAYYSPPVESSQLPEQFGILGEKSFTASPPGAGNDTPASYGDSEPYTVRFLDAPGPRLSAPNIVALRENTVIAWRMAAHHWVTWNGAVIPDSETGWMSYTYDITIRKTSPAGVSPITYTPLINTITPGTDQIDWMDIVEGRQLAGVE